MYTGSLSAPREGLVATLEAMNALISVLAVMSCFETSVTLGGVGGKGVLELADMGRSASQTVAGLNDELGIMSEVANNP